MKKLGILFMFVCGAFVVNAQDFKPQGGAKNLELQFAPLGGSPISISGIRYRQFLSANSAFRVNFFVGYHNEVTNLDTARTVGITGPELKDSKSSMTFNLRPGYEMHLAGTERLSPYFGGELDFAIKTSKEVDQVAEMNSGGTAFEMKERVTKGKNGSLRFGLNAVMGCDLYLVKNLYLGAEMGFGFSMEKPSDVKFSSNETGAPSVPDSPQKGSTFDIGPNVIGQLRIGYIF